MSASLRLSSDALRDVARSQGVCVRPMVHEVRDRQTGEVQLVPVPCGSTQSRKCAPCAEKARRIRMQQCREGWHLDAEPERQSTETQSVPDEEELSKRRVRSTRRRQDAGDLPRQAIDDRTLGRTFTAPSGQIYRPSMFATFTLPSYGPVLSDGTPVAPGVYDYRRAALDALHFAKLVDRMWQNLRRAVGYRVQYFAAVEAQRRLAPHLHAAVRGAIPRALFRRVVEGTYHQIWWPSIDLPVYVDELPVWTGDGYADPSTHDLLPTWNQALDALQDEAARPIHVLRFGRQLDLQGIVATEYDADRRVRYLTKYLAKSFGDTFGGDAACTPRQRAHLRRLHDEVRWLPCSTRCPNWLRFGVQPQAAKRGMVPGACPNKAHDEFHLGCGGRRVLVSRLWTGKTLKGHRADRAEVVRQVLLAAGVTAPEIERLSATATLADGTPRFEWQLFDPIDSTVPIYRQVMARAIAERMQWRVDYEAARTRAGPGTTPVQASR